MSNTAEKFYDKNHKEIKPGDVIRISFYARWPQRPGHKRVAESGMSGRTVVVPDEGQLLEAEKHWYTYEVSWSGACLIAKRKDCSTYKMLSQADTTDEEGNRVSPGAGSFFLSSVFKSGRWEVI